MFNFMKRKNKSTDLNRNPNHYDAVMVSNRRDQLRKRHASTRPWWANKAVIVGLTLVFSASDAVVLFTLFESAFVDSPAVGWVSALTTAILLNVFPIFLVTFAKNHIYHTQRLSKQGMLAMLLAFIILFSASVIFRLGNKDALAEKDMESTYGTMEVMESNAEEESDPALTSGLVILCLLPLATSVANGALAYFSPSQVESQIEALEHEILELEQKMAETEAALATMPGEDEIQFRLSMEEAEYEKAVSAVNSRIEGMRAQASLVLMEHVSNATCTTEVNAAGLQRLEKQRHSCAEPNQASFAPTRPTVVA